MAQTQSAIKSARGSRGKGPAHKAQAAMQTALPELGTPARTAVSQAAAQIAGTDKPKGKTTAAVVIVHHWRNFTLDKGEQPITAGELRQGVAAFAAALTDGATLSVKTGRSLLAGLYVNDLSEACDAALREIASKTYDDVKSGTSRKVLDRFVQSVRMYVQRATTPAPKKDVKGQVTEEFKAELSVKWIDGHLRLIKNQPRTTAPRHETDKAAQTLTVKDEAGGIVSAVPSKDGKTPDEDAVIRIIGAVLKADTLEQGRVFMQKVYATLVANGFNPATVQ